VFCGLVCVVVSIIDQIILVESSWMFIRCLVVVFASVDWICMRSHFPNLRTFLHWLMVSLSVMIMFQFWSICSTWKRFMETVGKRINYSLDVWVLLALGMLGSARIIISITRPLNSFIYGLSIFCIILFSLSALRCFWYRSIFSPGVRL